MAHLLIGKNCPFAKLQKMYREYSKKRNESKDLFERLEYERFISQIQEFCLLRGGWGYWYNLVEQSKIS